MLKNYIRDIEYFKKSAKNIKVFRTKDLYQEFVNLGNYFNDELIVEFEKILQQSLITVPNKFLINIGDGNINWVDIVEIIKDNSISLNKLEKIPVNSVLCTDENSNIIPITCMDEYAILFARYNNIHVWRKFTNEDIADNTITGNKIDKLKQINLSDSLINDFLTESIIESKNLTDNSISSDKITTRSLSLIDSNIIDIQSNDTVNKGFIPDRYLDQIGVNNLKAFRDSSLNVDKIMDSSIDFLSNPRRFVLREYSDNAVYIHDYINGQDSTNYEFPVNYNLPNAEILKYYNILPECIVDAHLTPYQNIGDWNNIPWHDNALEPRYFQIGYIAPKEQCRVEARCFIDGHLKLRHFDDEVRQALIAKGVTDDD